MPTIEFQHLLTGRAHVFRDQHAQAPQVGPRAVGHEVPAGCFELLHTRDRHDEAAQRLPIRALEVRRVTLESRPHVFARGWKQARVVHQPGEERVDGFQSGTRSIGSIIAEKLIPNACPARYQRSFSLRTNLSPDHVASTAQTFTSTSPDSSPNVRTTPSVRSVATPDVFLGHATQSIPLGSSLSRSRANPFSRSDCALTNSIAKSRAPLDAMRDPSGSPPSSPAKSFGSETNCSRAPGFIPSLSTSG